MRGISISIGACFGRTLLVIHTDFCATRSSIALNFTTSACSQMESSATSGLYLFSLPAMETRELSGPTSRQ